MFNSTSKFFSTLILLFISSVVQPIYAASSFNDKPDLEREKRMATEVEDAILDGEVVYLKDGSHEFMAIDTVPEGDTDGSKPKSAVILLHGRGFHADWEDTILPLRTQLAEQGWRTLSLQMPVLEKSAKYYDYVPLFPAASPRIEAGVKYLKDQGIDNVILFAHSCGAHMAMEWIRSKGDGMISAYIGAGMSATDYKQKMNKSFPLAEMRVPVLDIYGEDEYPAVIQLAPERKAAIEKAGNKKSSQVVVPKANHYFTDQGDALVSAVVKWLDTL